MRGQDYGKAYIFLPYAQTFFMEKNGSVIKNRSRIAKTFSEKRVTTVAGAWVFYFLTALLPIAFLMIIAFGVFGVDLHASLIAMLPEEFQSVGEAIVSTAEKATGGVTVFFAVAVVFSGSALLNQMLKDGEFLYGADSPKRSGLIKRLLSLAAVSALFVVFLGAALIAAFYGAIFNALKITSGIFPAAAMIATTVIAGLFIILLLNKFVCPVKAKTSSLFAGSFVSLAVVVAGTIGFTLYLRFFKPFNAFYGSLAGVIVFLIWAYILMLGLVIGVSVNACAYERGKKAKRRAAAKLA